MFGQVFKRSIKSTVEDLHKHFGRGGGKCTCCKSTDQLVKAHTANDELPSPQQLLAGHTNYIQKIESCVFEARRQLRATMETFLHTIIDKELVTCTHFVISVVSYMQLYHFICSKIKILLNAVVYLWVKVLLICHMFLHASTCRPKKNTCMFRMNMYVLLYKCISPDSTCKTQQKSY